MTSAARLRSCGGPIRSIWPRAAKVCLPKILQVIFPLTYWDSIRKNSRQHDLDPYVMAALIAQESTFDAGAHSAANAWGLMQIVPTTGRRLGRLGRASVASGRRCSRRPRPTFASGRSISRAWSSSSAALTTRSPATTRGRIGSCGGRLTGPGLDEDEFIDDIPFPETQNYVKRILGTAEDYRAAVQRRGWAGAPCHEGRHDEGFEYVEIIRGLEEVHSRQEETGDQEKAAFLTFVS